MSILNNRELTRSEYNLFPFVKEIDLNLAFFVNADLVKITYILLVAYKRNKIIVGCLRIIDFTSRTIIIKLDILNAPCIISSAQIPMAHMAEIIKVEIRFHIGFL